MNKISFNAFARKHYKDRKDKEKPEKKKTIFEEIEEVEMRIAQEEAEEELREYEAELREPEPVRRMTIEEMQRLHNVVYNNSSSISNWANPFIIPTPPRDLRF